MDTPIYGTPQIVKLFQTYPKIGIEWDIGIDWEVSDMNDKEMRSTINIY